MSDKIHLECIVNDEPISLDVYPMARLLDVLRLQLQLTGAKEGCGEGECGACAVIMDGILVNSCIVPAIHAQGTKITTVEGLAKGNFHDLALNPLQTAFHEKNGTQCGFCASGMLLASSNLLEHCLKPNKDQIKDGLSGNLCRCTGYSKIIEAIKSVAGDQS